MNKSEEIWKRDEWEDLLIKDAMKPKRKVWNFGATVRWGWFRRQILRTWIMKVKKGIGINFCDLKWKKWFNYLKSTKNRGS